MYQNCTLDLYKDFICIELEYRFMFSRTYIMICQKCTFTKVQIVRFVLQQDSTTVLPFVHKLVFIFNPGEVTSPATVIQIDHKATEIQKRPHHDFFLVIWL